MDIPEQRVHTTLPAARVSAAHARRFVSDTLRSWSVPADSLDTACLLTTELVTNAVLHAGTDVALDVESWDHLLRIEVTDASAAMPKPRSDDPHLGTTGRGLALVKRLSSTWGVTPREPGKCVWFELSTAGD